VSAPGNARRRFTARIQTLDGSWGLAEAALWIAAEEYPDLDVSLWLGRLDALGVRAREVITEDLDADGAAAALNRLLFEDYGLRGNEADYYDPKNSFLNEVLERRLGIPITLSLVYMAVGARAGVTIHGIGLPGHFVVSLERAGAMRLLDPFHGGRSLVVEDCRRLVERLSDGRLRFEPGHLSAVTPREILTRMLRNLKGAYLALGDWRRAHGAVDRLLLLAPEALDEGRDRGDLAARLGDTAGAIRDWETYLRRSPGAPDAERVRHRLRALRQALGRLN
jgi:regulator of sirC expression with transglutaminase-like and TPR domain